MSSRCDRSRTATGGSTRHISRQGQEHEDGRLSGTHWRPAYAGRCRCEQCSRPSFCMLRSSSAGRTVTGRTPPGRPGRTSARPGDVRPGRLSRRRTGRPTPAADGSDVDARPSGGTLDSSSAAWHETERTTPGSQGTPPGRLHGAPGRGRGTPASSTGRHCGPRRSPAHTQNI